LATAASEEIERLYQTELVSDSERVFFDQALTNYRSVTDNCNKITSRFKNHIAEIESLYHRDKVGEFARLWPEIYNIL
jgi:hypothetical protein